MYKITVGRDDLGMKEHGAVFNARMGLNTWAAFTGTQEDAVIAGDVAMLSGCDLSWKIDLPKRCLGALEFGGPIPPPAESSSAERTSTFSAR